MYLSPGVLHQPTVINQPYVVLSHGVIIFVSTPGAPFTAYYHPRVIHCSDHPQPEPTCPQCTDNLYIPD
ncbi:MAG: hypothetical protein RLZZ09_3111 [Pseudomonadota bacterium]